MAWWLLVIRRAMARTLGEESFWPCALRNDPDDSASVVGPAWFDGLPAGGLPGTKSYGGDPMSAETAGHEALTNGVGSPVRQHLVQPGNSLLIECFQWA